MMLTQQMKSVDVLIVAGFHPDKCVLDMMKKPVHLMFLEGTVYSKIDGPDDANSVITHLHNKGFKGLVAECVMYQKMYFPVACLNMNDAAKR